MNNLTTEQMAKCREAYELERAKPNYNVQWYSFQIGYQAAWSAAQPQVKDALEAAVSLLVAYDVATEMGKPLCSIQPNIDILRELLPTPPTQPSEGDK